MHFLKEKSFIIELISDAGINDNNLATKCYGCGCFLDMHVTHTACNNNAINLYCILLHHGCHLNGCCSAADSQRLVLFKARTQKNNVLKKAFC